MTWSSIAASGILSPKVMEIGNAIQYFDLNIHQLRHLTANDIISAKLHLHLAKAKNPLDLDVWIDTFLIQMDEYGQVVSNRIRTTKTTILPDFGGWVEINVEVAVSQWMRNPFNNMGLDFKITTGLNDTIAFGVDQEEVRFLYIFASKNSWKFVKTRQFAMVLLCCFHLTSIFLSCKIVDFCSEKLSNQIGIEK